MNSDKIREIPINSHQNQNKNDKIRKIQTFCENLSKNVRKNPKKSVIFEYGAVRRNVNLGDLEKHCKMSIWLLS